MTGHKKRDKHFSLRIDSALHARLRAAASLEDLTLSTFTRKLTRWAMQHYEQRGSLNGLSKNLPTKRATRRGVKGAAPGRLRY